MLYCSKCQIKVRTNHAKCPLCQSPLEGKYDEEDRVFPKTQKEKSHIKLANQLIMFISIVIIIGSFTVNWIVSSEIWWSLFVAGIVGCIWMVIRVGIAKRRNLMKNVLWQLVIIEGIGLVWDLATGWHKWSVNYVLPIGIVLALILMITLAIFQKLPSSEYLFYILLVAVVGMVPLLLLIFHVVTIEIWSVCCVSICAVIISALFVFQKSIVIHEIGKKFHI